MLSGCNGAIRLMCTQTAVIACVGVITIQQVSASPEMGLIIT